jgi:hypothetical protein
LSHGCGLGAVGHALAGTIGALLIPSGSGYWDLRPWGSHVLTDPLMSSSRVRFVHDGGVTLRLDKFETIARSPLALEELRVCWRGQSDVNCGRCSKCLRAMTCLELLGALGEARTFEEDELSLELVARVYCSEPRHHRELAEQVRRARSAGREDIARALSRALRGSRRRAPLLRLVRRRLPRRAARSLDRLLLTGWVRS